MSEPLKNAGIPESWLKKPDEPPKAAADMGPETTLMMATKAGDEQAFNALVSRLRNRAFYIAQSLVGSREDAMDLAQETFMKIFRARETFRDGEPFLPWFHRILRNTCYSHLRKNGRLRKVSFSAKKPGSDREGDWELADPKAHTAVDQLDTQEQAAAFEVAVEKLSARDREILSMRHHRELSYREIAESLGIPQGTVMSRLFHARRRLREHLDGLLEAGDRASGSEIQSLGDPMS